MIRALCVLLNSRFVVRETGITLVIMIQNEEFLGTLTLQTLLDFIEKTPDAA